MINLTLLKYEMKRLIFTKKYFYMILMLSIWTADMLIRLVIDGFYYTAPFSKWSYSEFITLFIPILFIILILLCTSIFSEKEKAVKNIICSAPISEEKYYMMKGISVFAVFLLTTAVPIIISFIYYAYLFEYTEYKNFIFPMILFLIPSSIFIFGLSIFVGKISNKVLYGLIPIVFILGGLNLTDIPVWLDIFGNNFLMEYGLKFILSYSSEEVPFVIPRYFIYSRVEFIILGILLFILACKYNKCKNKHRI